MDSLHTRHPPRPVTSPVSADAITAGLDDNQRYRDFRLQEALRHPKRAQPDAAASDSAKEEAMELAREKK